MNPATAVTCNCGYFNQEFFAVLYLYYLMTRDKTSNRPLLATVSIAKKKKQ